MMFQRDTAVVHADRLAVSFDGPLSGTRVSIVGINYAPEPTGS